MGLTRREATEVVGGGDNIYNWENLTPGDHEGRLAYIADLGLQAREFKNEFKGNFQQISLGIEIVGKGMEVTEDEVTRMEPRILWTKPFYIYSSMDSKGKEFEYYALFDTSAEVDTIPDWEAQLGKPISVHVETVKGTGKNKDHTYDNVKSIARIPEAYQAGVGELSVTPCIGDSDDPENVVTKGLFGLPKHVFDKRVKDGDVPAEESGVPGEVGAVPVTEESPY